MSIETTKFECGCVVLKDKETGKRLKDFWCGRHLGLLPKFNEFKPITAEVKYYAHTNPKR